MEIIEANPRTLEMLAQLEGMHRHLCPRQVLGGRMGLHAAELLGLEVPQKNKRMLALVETDGCFADGVSVATGCSMGHRTMRLMDYGKVAVTLVDTETGRAFRVAPRADVRAKAAEVMPDAPSRWKGQLEAYKKMAAEEMFAASEVEMNLNLQAVIGRPGTRVNCELCGEEILNQREVEIAGQILCRGCAGECYWRSM